MAGFKLSFVFLVGSTHEVCGVLGQDATWKTKNKTDYKYEFY